MVVHGLGAGWRSWEPVLAGLTAEREVIAIDLPGFGDSPMPPGTISIATLADAIEQFITEQRLGDVALAGQSMGARLVLELARRGVGGDVVALDPGGFWTDRERALFGATLRPSVALVKVLRAPLPTVLATAAGRTALLAQLSARPWSLAAETVLPDVLGLADAPGTTAALDALIRGPRQEGALEATASRRITIGWGRRDLVTLPRQAERAVAAFPGSHLHWFDRCGHFPQWDAPAEATRLILAGTAA